ncbi:hypothetical protein [Atlantibacter sp.]|nr:hypothetical protein [Atlantibacter sp.]
MDLDSFDYEQSVMAIIVYAQDHLMNAMLLKELAAIYRQLAVREA